jgi:collagenase-like PrtC family protease
VLVNPLTLPEPAARMAPRVIDALRDLMERRAIHSATIANPTVAARIREALPSLPLVASVLADISRPNQAAMVADLFDVIVPAGRILRDIAALRALRAAFPGRIRLLVNEGCLPGCLFRTQHFHEMGAGVPHPKSLCGELLTAQPWMRLTGAWVLPQHLRFYEGLYDELKLSGRETLRDPEKFRYVLEAYMRGIPLSPHEIGGGPASPLHPMEIRADFFARTLECGRNCHACSICREVWGTGPNQGGAGAEICQRARDRHSEVDA